MTRPALPVPLDLTFLPAAQDEGDYALPEGWVMKERKRSLVEVETNIRTLGQLYRTLSDLKKQLPSPVVADAEGGGNGGAVPAGGGLPGQEPPFVFKKRNSSMGWLPVTPVSKRSLRQTLPTVMDADRPWHAHPALAGYPMELFERLVQLHVHCTSAMPTWRDPGQFLAAFQQGTLHRGLLYAVLAYTALHGMMCHPESFPVSCLPTLLPLAQDCYDLASDALEFDDISTSTVEALVLLHLYANLAMQHEDHFLWVAKRQIQYLDYSKWWNFRAWFQRVEYATMKVTEPGHGASNAPNQDAGMVTASASASDAAAALLDRASNTTSLPTLTRPQQAPSGANDAQQSPELRARYSSASYDYPHYLQRLWIYYEIRGWALLRSEEATVAQLDAWMEDCTRTLQTEGQPFPTWQMLRLQSLYVAGLLHVYQRELMNQLAANDRWLLDDQVDDYFSFTNLAHHRLELAVHNGIVAAFQLIQTVLQLFSVHHRCLIPELVDTLSMASTIIYFGRKMSSDTHSQVAKEAEQVLRNLVCAFLQEPGMLQNQKVYQAVSSWQSMIQSFS
ncbi:hypothetical protein BC940DRAFT_336045 [Gongronella butleri]|nr:hypothetical protein BC940DRAFT_336045 [Gongronella butleri]